MVFGLVTQQPHAAKMTYRGPLQGEFNNEED